MAVAAVAVPLDGVDVYNKDSGVWAGGNSYPRIPRSWARKQAVKVEGVVRTSPPVAISLPSTERWNLFS
jgi:hypothetical protein